jgi:hypothetical protein
MCNCGSGSLFPRSSCNAACACYYRFTNTTADFTVPATTAVYTDTVLVADVLHTAPETGYYRVSFQAVTTGDTAVAIRTVFTVNGTEVTYGNSHREVKAGGAQAYTVTQDLYLTEADVVRIETYDGNGAATTITESVFTIMRIA